MKLTTFIIMIALVQVSASGFGQKITLNVTNTPIEQVLQSIREQSGFEFIYNVDDLKGQKVTLHLNDAAVEDAVKASIKDLALEYIIREKNIVLRKTAPSFLDKAKSVILNLVQDLDVKGKILDENGSPLEGATVVLKGTSRTAKTDAKGEFVLANVPDDGVLVIRYVGYKQLEIALKDAVMPLEIKLNVVTGELEEVKVVYNTGYQELNKERATGSFVQIDNELLNRAVSTNILDRITNVTNSLLKTNTPIIGGANTNITIRGISTISANVKPLFVVDGFPYFEGDEVLSNEARNFPNIINNLNPNDVESVTILRDAAAASIWGARAANGVIVITTKKGKYNQRTSVSVNNSLNLMERPDLENLEIMSSAEVIDYEKSLFASGFYDSYNGPFPSGYNYPVVSPAIEILLARKRNAITQEQAELQLNALANHDVRNDINKYIIRTAANQQYNLNVSGGSDKATYYASVGYDKNTATQIGNSDDRLTLRAQNTFRPIKNLELNSYISYARSRTENNGINYTSFIANGTSKTAPYTMLVDADGRPMHVAGASGRRTAYVDTLKTSGLLDWHYRPLEEINRNDNITKSSQITIGGDLSYNIIDGLKLTVNGQYTNLMSNLNDHHSIESYLTRDLINIFMYKDAAGKAQYPVPLGGILDLTNTNQTSWNLRGQVNYSKSWGIHSVTAIAGSDFRENVYDLYVDRKYGFDKTIYLAGSLMDYKTAFQIRPAGNAQIGDYNLLTGTVGRSRAYYANAGYTLLEKYTITGSFRIDAANFLGANTNLRAKPFWSTGVMWDVSKEKFYQFDFIPRLTLSVTYGINGNMKNAATPLPIITYSTASNIYNSNSTIARLSSAPNPGLTWEKSRILNLRVNWATKSDRISGSFEYYQKRGVNLIGTVIPEPTTGTSSYEGNTASMKGKGIDLSLNAKIINTSLKLNTSINFSYNTSEVTSAIYTDADLARTVTYLNSGAGIPKKPLSPMYSYNWAGLDPQTGYPMTRIGGQTVPATAANLANVKPEDLVYHGSKNPPIYGNILNSLEYKGFSISCNLIYRFGYFIKRTTLQDNTLRNNWGGHSDYSLRWQKPGDETITSVPSFPIVPDGRYGFYSSSEAIVERGDFIRLSDIRIDYTLNRKVSSSIGLINVTPYVAFQGLGILLWAANDKGIDPGGITPGTVQRSIAFGLRLNF